MSASTYVVVRSWSTREPVVCQGARCGQTIPVGEQVSHVVHERRFVRDPSDETSRAYLCDECVARIAERKRLRPTALSDLRVGAEPFTYRGKLVEAF